MTVGRLLGCSKSWCGDEPLLCCGEAGATRPSAVGWENASLCPVPNGSWHGDSRESTQVLVQCHVGDVDRHWSVFTLQEAPQCRVTLVGELAAHHGREFRPATGFSAAKPG